MTKLENEVNNKDKQIGEKDSIIKNFDLLIDKFKNDVEEKDRAIKNLQTDIEQEKREKEIIKSKLRFLEAGTEDFDMLQAISSTPNVIAERFDNIHLKDLENGTGFGEISNVCSSAVFQDRNSKYLPHMRDSYAIGAIDNNLSEYEMKVTSYSYH